jgi:uncharacterized protein YjbI with pentapeptide repeats
MDWRTAIRIVSLFLIGSIFLGFLFSRQSPLAIAHEHITATNIIIAQDTPTADATVTALQKEQLAEQVEQIKDQNSWSTWTNLATPLSILVGLLTVLGGVWRYLRDQRAEREKQHEVERQQLADRQAEREKQAEERFQKVVEGLGNSSEASQVGAAIMLRTFLRTGKGYEQFYSQAFDLAVAHLRLRNVDPKEPEPPTSLSQALVTVLKEAYPLARDWLQQHPRYLDAARIQLDQAYLTSADLQRLWIAKASLRKATLRSTNLSNANLNGVDFYKANLCGANLSGANLYGANLCEADLNGADLTNVDITTVKTWTNARLHDVKGLTDKQLAECKAKGAIIQDSV